MASLYSGQTDASSSSTQVKPKSAKASGKINIGGGTAHRALLGSSLRDKARGEALVKRRMREPAPTATLDDDGSANPTAPQMPEHISDPTNPMSYTASTIPELVPLNLLPTFVEMAHSSELDVVLHGVLMIRKLLSVTNDPPIREVMETGVLPRLIQLLECDSERQLQFEAAWAVCNIASGKNDDTVAVVRLGALPLFVRLLECPHDEIREQATWAVGNIASEAVAYRDELISLGAVRLLLGSIAMPAAQQQQQLSLMRNTVWALSNLCRLKPAPALYEIAPMLPTLTALLSHHDRDVATDACWAISYICEGTVDRIQSVIHCGALQKVVQMLTAPAVTMQIPALRTIGNIVTGNDSQTQTIIDFKALPAFHFLLNHPRRAIKKEACWCLSNICAGSVSQVQAVAQAELFPAIIRLLDAPEYDIKREAIWCIANTTSGGSRSQLRHLVDIEVIPPLCRALTLNDPNIVVVVLEALENFLQLGKTEQEVARLPSNPVANLVIACGGTDWIENLQSSNSPELYMQSKAVIEAFFEHREFVPEQTTDYNFDTSHVGAFESGGWRAGPGRPAQYTF